MIIEYFPAVNTKHKCVTMFSKEHMQHSLIYFAADYDCDAYGAGNFNSDECATQTAGTPDTGVVALTGSPYFVVGAVLLVAAIVFGVLMLRSKKR